MASRTPTEYLGQVQVCSELTFDKDGWPKPQVEMDLTTLLELTVDRSLSCRQGKVDPCAGRLPSHSGPSSHLVIKTIGQFSECCQVATVLRRVAATPLSIPYVPPEAKIMVRCIDPFSAAEWRNLPHFQLNESLNISSISVEERCLWSQPNPGENLNRQLFRVVRPTVEHLHLGADENRPSIATIAANLQIFFPNLKSVSLTSTPGSEYTTHVLIRLPITVEKIDIYKNDLDDLCVTGGHFRGENYDAMHVRLPNLTHLILTRCGMSDLSNLIFESTFKHMSLKVFGFIPDHRESCESTFHEGLSSLINGNAKDSLEKLKCFVPPDTSEEEMTNYFARFHRMRTCSLLELDFES